MERPLGAPTGVTSWASSASTRRSMLGNVSKGTKPEMEVRRRLHAQGFRYRVNYRAVLEVRRTADIAFTRHKIAVFIDGCFWHGCPAHYTAPTKNAEYWAEKVARNRHRDLETSAIYERNGWTVLRFWGHDDSLCIVEAVTRAVGKGSG